MHAEDNGAAKTLQASLAAGAAASVQATDVQPVSRTSWLPRSSTKTARGEKIGTDACAADHQGETASPSASMGPLVQAPGDGSRWDAGKGFPSPGSINNGIGLGLLVEEEDFETRLNSSRIGPVIEPPVSLKPAHDSAKEMADAVNEPTGGGDISTPTSGAPSTVQCSAAEALQGLWDVGGVVQEHQGGMIGLPSQHGMTTRLPLKTDQAAEMLVHIRETGIHEGRKVDAAHLESSEDSAGEP